MKKIVVFILFSVCLLSSIFSNNIIVNAEEHIGSEMIEEDKNLSSDNQIEPTSSGGGTDSETWNPLPVQNGMPKLAHAVDYSSKPELLKYLKRGDLIYEPEAGGGLSGHTAIVLGIYYDSTYNQEYVLLLEAVPNKVCYGVLTPTRFSQQHGIIKRFTNVSENDINTAIQWALTQYGEDYAISVSKNPNKSNDSWYCSELIWAAFYSVGVYLDVDDNDSEGGSIVWPSEINEYSGLTTVMHYDSTTEITNISSSMHQINCDGDTYLEGHLYEEYNTCYEKCRICDYMNQINQHDYTHRYSTYSSTKHKSYCECGELIYEDHIFEESEYTMSCTICTYVEYINHTHTFTYSPGLYNNHTATCYCGYSKTEPCMGLAHVGEPTRCIKCNRIMSGGTSIMSKREEDEVK